MLSIADIERARARMQGAVYASPCAYSETFSRQTGARVYFKLENLQMTGSFKERGACNKLLSLLEAAPTPLPRVIAASAGNHAQGVAYHAARLGLHATIVMPVATALIKVANTRGHGAEVVLHGANYDEAFAEASARAAATGDVLIHAFDDLAVMAGQGTIGLELLEQNPQLDVVVVPIGGGGLAAGVATAIKETNPRVKIVGVQSVRIPSLQAARTAGAPVTVPPQPTIADGIAVRRVGALTLPLLERHLDELLTVDEEELAAAVLMLLEREKTVAEGAGAASLAALLSGRMASPTSGRRVALVVSGGNIDVNLLSRIIERGLVKGGRLVRLRVRIVDTPGGLHRLTGLVATLAANILEVHHNRAFSRVDLGETAVDITLETRGLEHVSDLARALSEAGYEHERLT